MYPLSDPFWHKETIVCVFIASLKTAHSYYSTQIPGLSLLSTLTPKQKSLWRWNFQPTRYITIFLRRIQRVQIFKIPTDHIGTLIHLHYSDWCIVGDVSVRANSYLTLSHPEALHWRVKSSAVRQSKITKGTVLAGLGEERLTNCILYIQLGAYIDGTPV